ncbi:hypothetical protein [Leptothoe spongobia]|uniref:Uncharacterized protein n=1 Tax=Leptothoe spongobia TAU-MAC 1115 TaxID=1967444 RepID=A0A947GFP8_9CYAN|nr:hypothetical protein [Leptothoe spongobia]MBT9314470.1 hypothetical protein [Leptothoe spongobia TAU-MAC 1115]
MVESPTISSAPPVHPGMNYALLRQAGIDHIAKLAGDLWTDYNAHDPGITILENLCYAITDLSYRLSFDMEDLLAYPADAPLEGRQQFFTAREILTVNPLTINDYRKLLIDIHGVKNAWLEPLDNPEPALYTDATHSQLSFATPDLTEPVKLKGLYRVLIEQDPNYADAQSLIDTAKARLYPRRNLCEDFAEIKVLALEEITVRTELEIEDGVDPNVLMAQIYVALDRLISPDIDFFSLKELLAQGAPPETIFEGPALAHGFINTEQLEQFDRKTELHVSDFIHVILDIADVKAVRQITIASNQSPAPQAWALDLDPNLTPRIKSIEKVLQDFTFYNGQITYTLNEARVKRALKVVSQANRATTSKTDQPLDLPIPKGEDRELADYESIQNDFPLTYGIGDIGLPPSANTERKAQAKQLQAYLMVFDQLLANAFAQLDHVKDLFSFHNPALTTYFAQSIAHHPGAEAILAADYAQSLESLHEDESSALERKNRLLNHLMAHYSEKSPGDSLLFSEAALSATTIQKKVDFLSDYLTISAGRGRAVNVAIASKPDNTDNVSGLKRRISRLLGLPPSQQFLSTDQQEGFFILEHILLRPKTSNAPDETPGFLSFAQPITAFSPSSVEGRVTCFSPAYDLSLLSLDSTDDLPSTGTNLVVVAQIDDTYYARIFNRTGNKVVDTVNVADNHGFAPDAILVQELETAGFITEAQAATRAPIPEQTKSDLVQKITTSFNHTPPSHGLKIGETITIFYSSHYSGNYRVTATTTDTFDIVADYVEDDPDAGPDTGSWVRSQQPTDPFSFQISIVIPDWPKHFQDKNFRQLLHDTIISETPAHITIHLHWLDAPTMQEFQSTYNLRLQELSGTAIAGIGSRDVTYRLLNLLQLGTSTIPDFPAMLGYMAIGDDFVVF